MADDFFRHSLQNHLQFLLEVIHPLLIWLKGKLITMTNHLLHYRQKVHNFVTDLVENLMCSVCPYMNNLPEVLSSIFQSIQGLLYRGPDYNQNFLYSHQCKAKHLERSYMWTEIKAVGVYLIVLVGFLLTSCSAVFHQTLYIVRHLPLPLQDYSG